MIFGMTTFTFVHVVLSLVGIGSGFIVVFGLLDRETADGWTSLFLATTVATSVTGFLFLQPLLAVPWRRDSYRCRAADCHRRALRASPRRTWRWIYAVGAVMALYLNVFVLIAQLFSETAGPESRWLRRSPSRPS